MAPTGTPLPMVCLFQNCRLEKTLPGVKVRCLVQPGWLEKHSLFGVPVRWINSDPQMHNQRDMVKRTAPSTFQCFLKQPFPQFLCAQEVGGKLIMGECISPNKLTFQSPRQGDSNPLEGPDPPGRPQTRSSDDAT